jgi:hypothetical protein
MDEKLAHPQCRFLFALYELLRPDFQRIQLLETIILVHDSVVVYPRPLFQGLWDPTGVRSANLEPYIRPVYPLELRLFDYVVPELLNAFIDRCCECEPFLQPLCCFAILALVWHESNRELYMKKQGPHKAGDDPLGRLRGDIWAPLFFLTAVSRREYDEARKVWEAFGDIFDILSKKWLLPAKAMLRKGVYKCCCSILSRFIIRFSQRVQLDSMGNDFVLYILPLLENLCSANRKLVKFVSVWQPAADQKDDTGQQRSALEKSATMLGRNMNAAKRAGMTRQGRSVRNQRTATPSVTTTPKVEQKFPCLMAIACFGQKVAEEFMNPRFNGHKCELWFSRADWLFIRRAADQGGAMEGLDREGR